MNLSLKIRNWYIELIFVICIFKLMSLFFTSIGDNKNNYLLIRFFANCLGQTALLIYAIYRIKKMYKNCNLQVHSYFKNSISFIDIVYILIIVIIGPITYRLLLEIEPMHIFDKHMFSFDLHFTSSFQSWSWVSLMAILIVNGVLAEEFYFRGYLFEIQHIQFKKYAWLLNGMSFSIYHVFSPINFLALLPTCLLYSIIYQKRRNIWITISAHLINNFIALYPALKTYLK